MNVLIINCSPVKTGATARIAEIAAGYLQPHFTVKQICIDDYAFRFCTGCRSCHDSAKCVLPDDGVLRIMSEYEWADIIICVSPSYWADVPGQFKAFIDRCTPWCNTHEPHASISAGKKGYAIALRTGPSMRECNRIIESIAHFHGHLEITSMGHLGLPSIENRRDIDGRKDEIEAFCSNILQNCAEAV